jgi:hypothetical protein
LPNGGTLGTAGHAIYAFGVSDNGSVVFTGLASGTASDGTSLGDSVYTARPDGSHLATIADEDHLFYVPGHARTADANCVGLFGNVAVGGNTVVFSGAGAALQPTLSSIYAQPVGSTPRGATPINVYCELHGSAGPIVWNSLTLLPGDPAAHPRPESGFTQTDGANVYFQGFDNNLSCCSSPGGWGGVFSVSLAGGAAAKIVEDGDTLPVIGKVTDVSGEFSVDRGDVAFIAFNNTVSPTLRGIFLLHRGKILKVFASGDHLDGGVLNQNGPLEVWPQSLSNGKLAFMWDGGIFVATEKP